MISRATNVLLFAIALFLLMIVAKLYAPAFVGQAEAAPPAGALMWACYDYSAQGECRRYVQVRADLNGNLLTKTAP